MDARQRMLLSPERQQASSPRADRLLGWGPRGVAPTRSVDGAEEGKHPSEARPRRSAATAAAPARRAVASHSPLPEATPPVGRCKPRRVVVIARQVSQDDSPARSPANGAAEWRRVASPVASPPPERKTSAGPDDPQQSSEERIQWLRDRGVTVETPEDRAEARRAPLRAQLADTRSCSASPVSPRTDAAVQSDGDPSAIDIDEVLTSVALHRSIVEKPKFDSSKQWCARDLCHLSTHFPVVVFFWAHSRSIWAGGKPAWQ